MAEYKVRNMLVLDEDAQKTIKIGNDAFVVRAIFPRDRKEIARRVSIEQNGLPMNSFSTESRYQMERDAVVAQQIVTSPDWWRGPDDCLEDEIIETLYTGIISWTQEFQEALKKNKFARGGAKPEVHA